MNIIDRVECVAVGAVRGTRITYRIARSKQVHRTARQWRHLWWVQCKLTYHGHAVVVWCRNQEKRHGSH